MESALKHSWKKINHVVVSGKKFKFLKITFFVKSSPPLPGLPTRSVIFYHMTLILFVIHSFDLGQCPISYFMLISHTEIFLDTLKVWSKRDFCKFAPP